MSRLLRKEEALGAGRDGAQRGPELRPPRGGGRSFSTSRKKAHGVAYFAYGSNLDAKQMHFRCAGATLIARAVLPNYALAFGGHSCCWRGPVASVVRKPGRIVEGLLYQLPDPDLNTLDGFEGCPWSYRRVERLIVDEYGRRCHAQVYLQSAAKFIVGAPSNEYFDILWRAYIRFGFDPWPLAAAARRSS